jgi:hypothetical protein
VAGLPFVLGIRLSSWGCPGGAFDGDIRIASSRSWSSDDWAAVVSDLVLRGKLKARMIARIAIF